MDSATRWVKCTKCRHIRESWPKNSRGYHEVPPELGTRFTKGPTTMATGRVSAATRHDYVAVSRGKNIPCRIVCVCDLEVAEVSK